MPVILLLTVLGFLIGLSYVMIERKIRPGPILAATFLGLVASGAWNVFKKSQKNKRKWS